MAKAKAVTFGELVEALGRFQYALDPTQSAEGYSVFRHPDRPIRIILPSLNDRSAVRPVHLVTVRHFLEDSDPAEAREFDAWLDSRGARPGHGTRFRVAADR